jgi:tetratricopeptide (TPR) repeat protein
MEHADPHAATLATLPAPVAPPDRQDLASVDAANYHVVGELARGGMGRIRVARDLRLGRQVAIKDVIVRDESLTRRLEREARITARLQHPSIVSVYEAGTWANGIPFYAMPLIDGRSLDDVIAERPTLDARLALVPNVLAVADAIAYAHGQRVIHRDLKPRNVLVGIFGQTVVIDWGLAKDLDAPVADDDSPYRTSTNDVATMAGEVIGTPAYMPPEQANGDSVDERADVYAIGALLVHVLTGTPPYTGRDVYEILDAVRSGPPAPVSELEPGTPMDLVAIVERAMARDAASRYPTARELAEDLRRFQTGQLVGAHRYTRGELVRRWIKRHRAMVLAAIAIVATTAIAGQRIVHAKAIADEQRDRAVASRADAEDLLGYMVGDLRDRLQPMGRLDVLDGVARKAVGYYTRHAEEPGTSMKRAGELATLGRLLTDEGHLDEAEQQLATTLSLYEHDGLSIEWQRIAAQAHEGLADVRRARRDNRGALRELDQAQVLRRDTSGRVEQRRGEILVLLEDVPAATEAFRASLASALDQLRRDPGSKDALGTVATAHDRLGGVYTTSGSTDYALVEYREEIATLARLPTDDSQRDLMANARLHLAVNLRLSRDLDGALREVQLARELREQLVSHDPQNTRWQFDYAMALLRSAQFHLAAGDVERSLADYRTRLAIVERLVALDPSNTTWRAALATNHVGIGDVEMARGQLAAAVKALRVAERILDDLAAKSPDDALMVANASAAHDRIAIALAQLGDHRGACDELAVMIRQSESLLARDPTNLGTSSALEEGHERMAVSLLALGEREAAIREATAARKMLDGRLSELTDDPVTLEAAITVGETLGNASLALHDNAAATAGFRTALPAARRLLELAPTPELRARVATLERLAR